MSVLRSDYVVKTSGEEYIAARKNVNKAQESGLSVSVPPQILESLLEDLANYIQLLHRIDRLLTRIKDVFESDYNILDDPRIIDNPPFWIKHLNREVRFPLARRNLLGPYVDLNLTMASDVGKAIERAFFIIDTYFSREPEFFAHRLHFLVRGRGIKDGILQLDSYVADEMMLGFPSQATIVGEMITRSLYQLWEAAKEGVNNTGDDNGTTISG